ncbi:MAG: putative DNA binding domain-containing protein [Deltaproteobacteria bacterium]|jgi:predicted HTH transcriptional regulator|nr:putative DNA binding domain-containing protein [Deltaproteobacteria bacterium]
MSEGIVETQNQSFIDKANFKFSQRVVSFLNHPGGGVIYVGVNPSGNVLPNNDIQHLKSSAADQINNNISPCAKGLFDINVLRVNAKPVLQVTVAGGVMRPYFILKEGMSPDGCFRRSESSMVKMTREEIEAAKSRDKDRGRCLCNIPSPNERLSFNQLRIAYQEAMLEHSQRLSTELDLFLKSGPTGNYNMAGYLLSDQNLKNIGISKYSCPVAERNRNDQVERWDMTERGRSVITSLNMALNKVEVEAPGFAEVTFLRLMERSLVDKQALREAVVNAVVHNDYSMGNPIIEIFSDVISVVSCGGLIKGFSRQDMFSGRSMPRNRELLRVFKDLGFSDHVGSGVRYVASRYDESIFHTTDKLFRVTFPLDYPPRAASDLPDESSPLTIADI